MELFPLETEDSTHITPRNSIKGNDDLEDAVRVLQERIEYMSDADAIEDINKEIRECRASLTKNKTKQPKKLKSRSQQSFCSCFTGQTTGAL